MLCDEAVVFVVPVARAVVVVAGGGGGGLGVFCGMLTTQMPAALQTRLVCAHPSAPPCDKHAQPSVPGAWAHCGGTVVGPGGAAEVVGAAVTVADAPVLA
jgi:hypothetical protein